MAICQSGCQMRGFCYFSGSRDHFALAFDNTCTKACMTKVTSRLEYTEVLHYYFLYLIPRYYMHKCTKVTCMFGFKWNNPNAIIMPILLQFMYHNECMYYPFFFSGYQIDSKQIFNNGLNLASGSKSLWPDWKHVVVIHCIIINVHFYLID